MHSTHSILKVGETECACVASGAFGRVLLAGEAFAEFKKLEERVNRNEDQNSVRQYRTLVRYFERYAATGPSGLSEQMYKPQQKVKLEGDKSVHVHEFKAHQYRIYGCVSELSGIRTFLGTTCDPSKKKDKADLYKIEKSAKEWWRISNAK